MPVSTSSVRNRIIGEARKSFEEAAGSNRIISRNEAKSLPQDLAAAVDKAREDRSRVTVDDAVDVYASHVSHVLAAVDRGRRGTLSEAEANNILDPSLRRRVLDVRAELAGSSSTGSTGERPTTGQAVAELTAAVHYLDLWHERGDRGVSSTASAHPEVRSLAAALAQLTTNPDTPWTSGEGSIVLDSARGTDAVEVFLAKAAEKLTAFSSGHQTEIDSFAANVRASCGRMSSVRVATGQDLDGVYLLGKTKNGYVSLCVQGYGDSGPVAFKDRLAALLVGAVLEGDDGARGTVKAFESSGTLDGALTPAAVLETLKPDWSELKLGLWGSADLDVNSPELGDVTRLAAGYEGGNVLERNLEVTYADDGSVDYRCESQEQLQGAMDLLRAERGEPLVMAIGVLGADGNLTGAMDRALVVVVKTPDDHLTGFIAGLYEE